MPSHEWRHSWSLRHGHGGPRAPLSPWTRSWPKLTRSSATTRARRSARSTFRRSLPSARVTSSAPPALLSRSTAGSAAASWWSSSICRTPAARGPRDLQPGDARLPPSPTLMSVRRSVGALETTAKTSRPAVQRQPPARAATSAPIPFACPQAICADLLPNARQRRSATGPSGSPSGRHWCSPRTLGPPRPAPPPGPTDPFPSSASHQLLGTKSMNSGLSGRPVMKSSPWVPSG